MEMRKKEIFPSEIVCDKIIKKYYQCTRIAQEFKNLLLMV